MAVTCLLNQNLLRTANCGYSLFEVANLYLINYDQLSGNPAISSDEDGQDEVTGITLTTDSKAYKIVPAKNSASFSDELVVNDNGSKYRTASLTFTVSGAYTKVAHAALDALSLGRYTAVIQLSDGTYIMLGRISPLEAETATLNGGSEGSGMEITLSGNIAESALPLAQSAITQLLSYVAE